MTFSYVFKRIWWKFKFSDFLKKSKLHRKTVSEVFQYCSYSGGHLFHDTYAKEEEVACYQIETDLFFYGISTVLWNVLHDAYFASRNMIGFSDD